MPMTKIHFYKMHGAGNDFILFDNSSRIFSGRESGLFKNMCLPHTGVGSDGMMLLEKSEKADFKLRYYNSNGLPSEMCGNGARCAVYLANSLGFAPKECAFEINKTIYHAEVSGQEMVRLKMHPPTILISPPEAKSLLAENFKGAILLRVGVPHFVIESAQLMDDLDIYSWGKHYRYHERFQPDGTNVNFVFPSGQSLFKARVYERGVEAETLACGTGAIACSFYGNRKYKWQSPIDVQFPGGTLQVEFDPEFENVFLVGPVKRVFEGDFELSYFGDSVQPSFPK
jgi:diaminopimelate epimerase